MTLLVHAASVDRQHSDGSEMNCRLQKAGDFKRFSPAVPGRYQIIRRFIFAMGYDSILDATIGYWSNDGVWV